MGDRLMEKQFSLPELVKGVSDRMRIDFEQITKTIPAPLDRGEGRETVLRTFLKDYLPKRFGIDAGFVIDASGNVSKQMDVVKYDVGNAPVFKIVEDKKVFPVECVCAIGEVKSYLGKKELNDALEKIRSAKRLDKTNSGKSERRHGGGYVGEHLRRDHHNDRVFGIVFAYDGVSLEAIASNLHAANKSIDRAHWGNLVCVLDRGIVSYVTEEGILLPDPQKAVAIYSTDESESHNALLTFYSILWSFLSASHTGTVEMFDYLGTHTQQLPVRRLALGQMAGSGFERSARCTVSANSCFGVC